MPSRLFTEDDLRLAIEFYLEFTQNQGYDSESAKIEAVNLLIEGYDATVGQYNNGEIDNLPIGERYIRAANIKEE